MIGIEYVIRKSYEIMGLIPTEPNFGTPLTQEESEELKQGHDRQFYDDWAKEEAEE